MPALAVAGASLLVGSIKLLVGRPRPESAQLAGVGGYSFPSGHTLHAVVLYFSTAIVLTVLGGDDRRAFALWAIIAGAIALAVGVSRVYLGAHFASDVLAAWFLGALWVYVFFASLRHHVSSER
ncbi:MAG: hypothetical protein CVT69_01245 [Actinobacteria bacterium HGW-Actinobacteria-9]|jgi:undecaprenyl-diphosphatase|nr:MAG: hypothetical protein CVT69_01245 [Actinobacteria bacterium HGW-Actinobacteria-9]